MGKYIKSFHYRDKVALCTLARSGILYRKDFESMDIKKSRLYKYDEKKEGLTKRCFAPDGKEYYVLTQKGKDEVERRWGVQPYTHRPGMYEHDKDLRNKIMSLTPEQRETIQTEREFQNDMRDTIQDWKNSGDKDLINKAYEFEDKWHRGELSSPDFTYEPNPGSGERVFYETITKNYTEQEIQAKFEMANACGCQIEWNRV